MFFSIGYRSIFYSNVVSIGNYFESLDVINILVLCYFLFQEFDFESSKQSINAYLHDPYNFIARFRLLLFVGNKYLLTFRF